jgi:hypothetical protein
MVEIQDTEGKSEQAREILPFEAAMKRLGTPPEVFNALLASGLLGDFLEEGVPVLGVEHYERFGTQWRQEIGERLLPNMDSTFPQGVAGGHQPPSTYTQIQISHYPSPYVVENDTGWIAQFFLNRTATSTLILVHSP